MTSTALSSTLKGGALILLLALIYTGLFTADRTTWLMEVTPVIIIVPLLLSTHRRYPLTPLLYTLIFFHALILIGGGMYTYAKVPIGFDVQDWLGLSRFMLPKIQQSGHLLFSAAQRFSTEWLNRFDSASRLLRY